MLTVSRHFITVPLLYEGDCKLLGITTEGVIYAEELYGEHDWLAQHKIIIDEGVIDSVDELAGENPDMRPFKLPHNIIVPCSKPYGESMDFKGARLRGIQREERIAEMVLPLSMEDKIALVHYMEWDILPMQIIGIAESVILSYTRLSDETFVMCRRVRVAYRLTEQAEQEGNPYDYDSLEVHILHEFDPHNNELPELGDCLSGSEDVDLLRPMDCLYHDGRLYVADGGEEGDVSAIHVFEVQEKLEN